MACTLPTVKRPSSSVTDHTGLVAIFSGKPFGEALASAEKIYLDEMMSTADAHEGLTAFMEKRKPEWEDE